MPQSTAVKLFRSTDIGAPTLTGAAGDMAALLHACLVTGYNVSAVDSITREVSTVTVTVFAGHGLEQGVVVQIAGADQSEYNGDHRITATTATTFEYEFDAGVEPVTPATGTIEARMAPAGWERSFVSGDNQRAAFRSLAVDSTRMYLYIDDANNQGVRRTGVKGYDSMTDIDTGSNPFPYSGADDKWCWWYKSADEVNARDWAIIADDRFFWLWWNRDGGVSGGRLNAFGDIISHVPADAYHCLVSGEWSSTDENYQPMLATVGFCQGYAPNEVDFSLGVHFARDWYGNKIGSAGLGAVSAWLSSPYFYSSTGGARAPFPLGFKGSTFPSPISGGVLLVPVYHHEGTDIMTVVRGQSPGLYAPLHERPYGDCSLVDGSGSLADRRFIALPFKGGKVRYNATNQGPVGNGQVLVDIIGPWR